MVYKREMRYAIAGVLRSVPTPVVTLTHARACCNNCQFRSYGTECRAAAQECDIAEYCTGYSNECPEDDHRSNGILCNSNAGYCLDGQCPTLADPCSSAWGEFARIYLGIRIEYPPV